MKTIHKYRLDPGALEVEMPEGAKVLSAGCQGDGVFVWALVDDANPMKERTFLVYGTGHPAECAPWHGFVGTALMRGGALVWHVFEVTE